MTKRAKRTTRKSAASSRTRRRGIILGGIAALALVAVAVLLATSLNSVKPERENEATYFNISGGVTEEGFPYLGSLEADVTLIEFTDFYCSHCRTYNLETEHSILEEYVSTGRVRYVLHYYSNGSPQSLQATEAAMCAADQGQYFQFQRAFFENPAATRADFIALAGELGLDEDDFTACWDAGRYHNALMAHIQAARSAGISATPSFMINDQLVVGNRPDVVRQIIEEELAAD